MKKIKQIFEQTLPTQLNTIADEVMKLTLIPSVNELSQMFGIHTKDAERILNHLYPDYFLIVNTCDHEDDFREKDKEYDVTRMGDLPKKSFEPELFDYIEEFCINAKRSNIEVILDTERFTRVLKQVLKTYAEYGFIYQYQLQAMLSVKTEINKMLQDEELMKFLVEHKDNILDTDYVTDYCKRTSNELLYEEYELLEEPYYEDRGEHNEDEELYIYA